MANTIAVMIAVSTGTPIAKLTQAMLTIPVLLLVVILTRPRLW
jgi:hypothetical protein